MPQKPQIYSFRLLIVSVFVICCSCVLLNRLWILQITDSEELSKRGEEESMAKVRLAPMRGEIFDRKGIPLAENRLTFNLDLNLDDLQRDFARHHRRPMITFPPGKDGKVRPPEIDIVEIVKESLQPLLDSLGIEAAINDKEIVEHFRSEGDLPYHFLTDLPPNLVAQFKERNLGIIGVNLSPAPVRTYTYGALAAHIMGYIGRPVNDSDQADEEGVPYDMIGRHGLELFWDDQLQGQSGWLLNRVSPLGYLISEVGKPHPPQVGSSLYLTIDAQIQYIVEMALRKSGVGRAAAVVMDPRNGDVLALASIPSYDPNKFIPSISPSQWKGLNEDPTAPMFNRALHGLAPGSTYKIMVALAGLKSGRVTPDTQIDCPGAIQIGDHLFHNSDSKEAGYMALTHAIQVSSDVFFYQYGIKAGIDAIDDMGQRVGLGHRWNLLGDQDEDAGILPGPAWMKQQQIDLKKRHPEHRFEEHWSDAQTANTSIGQGYVLATPLQMATFLCSVANGGTVYQPRLYNRIVDETTGNFLPDNRIIPPATVYNHLDVKPSDLKAVQDGMLAVVEDGTGTLAHIPGFQIAGKTGTAQAKIRINGEVRRDLKGWFYCYGPFQSPRYVVCVMVEGVTWGGTSAAPIAKDIFQGLINWENGNPVQLTYLEPAVGNFNGVSVIESSTSAAAAPSHPAPLDTSNIPVAPSAAGDDDKPSPMGETNPNEANPIGDAPPANPKPASASTAHPATTTGSNSKHNR